MKLTEKTVKTEKKTTELVCELTEEEFKQLGAETAAQMIVDLLDSKDDETDIAAYIAMTAMLAQYSAKLSAQMFYTTDKTNETENKEEK